MREIILQQRAVPSRNVFLVVYGPTLFVGEVVLYDVLNIHNMSFFVVDRAYRPETMARTRCFVRRWR